MPVNGANTRANWLSVLAGTIFNNGHGVTYGANDLLFIYNTGHGASEDAEAPGGVAGNSLNFTVAQAGRFDTRVTSTSEAGTVTDPSGYDLL